MFRLLKDLTASRKPKKVLVRVKVRHPVTKNVNVISLVKMEKEKNTKNNEVIDKNIIELIELNVLEPKEVVDVKEEVENRINNDKIGSMKEKITREEIKELVEMPRYNDSLLATRLGKMDYERYNSLHVGIAEDVLVEIADYVYLIDFVILDVKEDKKKPFILGIPFLTTSQD
nr:hypothetical protein [Tanacetum cinerariifolium]